MKSYIDTATFVAHIQCLCGTQDYSFSYYDNRFDKSSTIISHLQLKEIVTTGAMKNKHGMSVADLTRLARENKAGGDHNGFNGHKGQAPAFTPAASCNFGGHKKENIASYTGLLMYDIDHLQSGDMARRAVLTFSQQPYTYAAWVTTSGCGVRLLVRYLPDDTAQALLKEEYGLVGISQEDYNRMWLHGKTIVEAVGDGYTVDQATKDPSRISYLSHDEEAYFNLAKHSEENSIVVGVEVLRPMPPAKEIAVWLKKENKTFTTDPHTLACRWVEQRGKYYHEGNRNNFLLDYACLMCEFGASEEECLRQAGMMPNALGEEETQRVVGNGYRRVRSKGKEGCLAKHLTPKATGKRKARREDNGEQPIKQEQVIAYITANYDFRYNMRSRIVDFCKKGTATHPNPLMNPYTVLANNGSLNNLWVETNRALGFMFPIRAFDDTLRSDAVYTSHDIIKDYLRYCKETTETQYGARPAEEWYTHNPYYVDKDNHPIATPWRPEEDQIQKIANAIHSSMPQAMLRQAIAIWMVSIAATATNSKRKGHTMPILVGAAGIGKSNIINSVAPKHAEGVSGLVVRITPGELTYTADRKELDRKLSNYLIAVVDEFSQPSAKEANKLKELITCLYRSHRIIYTENVENCERVATLCAATNDFALMSYDKAEMRRYLPIQVNSVENNGIIDIDDVLLYGQAMWLLEKGMKYWLETNTPSGFEEELFQYIEQFTCRSDEENLILTHLYPSGAKEDTTTGEALRLTFMTSTDIFNRFAQKAPCAARNMNPQSIGKAMVKLGYTPRKRNGKIGYLICFKDDATVAREALDDAIALEQEANATATTAEQETKPDDNSDAANVA